MGHRHQGTNRAVQRGQRVAQAYTHPYGRTIGKSGHVAQTAHALGDGRKARSLAVRARLPVAGDADHNKLRIEGRQLLPDHRSEEHTSELPSLMRISYTVFCLNTKKSHIILFIHYATYTN